MRLGLGVKAGGDDGTTRELAWLKMIVKVELCIQREREGEGQERQEELFAM